MGSRNFQADRTLSVVLPCFNEEESIPVVLPRLVQTLQDLKSTSRLQDFEIIVVDDHSTDSSLQLLSEYEAVKVVSNPMTQGYGQALKSGFIQARHSWISFLDMDNSYRPEDLVLFIDALESGSSDFIMGMRGLSESGMTLTRGLGNWFYQRLAKTFYRSHLNDVCSGYRLFHRSHLDHVTSIPEEGLDYSIHLTLSLLTSGVGIQPVDISYDPRLGESKLSVIDDGLAFLKVLLFLKLRRLRAFKHSRVQ